jgi:hypothetical protein
VIPELRGCLLCFVTVLAGVTAEADAGAPLRDVLAAALEANERLARLYSLEERHLMRLSVRSATSSINLRCVTVPKRLL